MTSLGAGGSICHHLKGDSAKEELDFSKLFHEAETGLDLLSYCRLAVERLTGEIGLVSGVRVPRTSQIGRSGPGFSA